MRVKQPHREPRRIRLCQILRTEPSHRGDECRGPVGQRQRVALARALVSGRPLILLDEPFSSLDPTLRRDMILLVDEMRRKRPVTILMTIHTPEDAADVADQMAFVADGKVVASGRPADILNSALAPRIAAAVSNS